MARERSINLGNLAGDQDPSGNPPKTHYAVAGECSNCDYCGPVHIPRGTSCPVGAVIPSECPECGCNNLTRPPTKLPPGLEAFVDRAIADGMITANSRNTAIATMATLPGCWDVIKSVHTQKLSEVRELELYHSSEVQTLQLRLAQLQSRFAEAAPYPEDRLIATGIGHGLVATNPNGDALRVSGGGTGDGVRMTGLSTDGNGIMAVGGSGISGTSLPPDDYTVPRHQFGALNTQSIVGQALTSLASQRAAQVAAEAQIAGGAVRSLAGWGSPVKGLDPDE